MSNQSTNTPAGLTIEQNGGLTRVSHGHEAVSPVAAAPYESNRVAGGTIKLDMGTGQTSQGGLARYTIGEDRNTSSVAATLQRINGQDTVELEPGNPASRTHIRQALADGLIEPVGPGLWRDRGHASQSAADAAAGPAKAPEQFPEVGPDAGGWDPEEDAAWAADIEPLPQHAYDSAAASVAVAVMSGADNLDRAAATLAEQAAIPVDLAQQYVSEGYGLHERVVSKEVAALGVGPEEKQAFYDWLRETKGRALHEAIVSLTARRDVGPFRVLALEFKRHH